MSNCTQTLLTVTHPVCPEYLPLCKIALRSDQGISPPHIRCCLSNVHSASFLGSSNSPRPLRRFYRSLRRKTSFRARICLLWVAKSYILTPFPQNGNVFWGDIRLFGGIFPLQMPRINTGRSVLDNGFANREEMGCQASNIGVSKQEMVSIKSYSSA